MMATSIATQEPRIVYLKPKIGATLPIIVGVAEETPLLPPSPPAVTTLHQDEKEGTFDDQQRLLSASVPDLLAATPTEVETSEETGSREDEMNGLLSLPQQLHNHASLPFSPTKQHNGHVTSEHLMNGHSDVHLKHMNGYCNGSAELLSCTTDDVTPPPSFSRLPPDGHEFPPSYMEPSVAPVIGGGVSKWRQDEKSLRSVKDKIALFSCTEEANNTVTDSPASLGRFRSTEDIHLSGPVSANLILERAVSTADLQCPAPAVPRFSTLPRKPICVSVNNNNKLLMPSGPMSPSAGLGRALSFSHSRSQSLVDVTTSTQRPLSALLEQRRLGISKLRGLVIPERPELLAAAPTVVDLPEIRSRELVQTTKSRSLHHEPIVVSRVSATATTMPASAPPPPPPQQQLLPALPSMPKYSPAFKRKSFSLLEIKQQPLVEPPVAPTLRVQDHSNYNKSFSNYFTKPDTLQLQCSQSDPPKSLESLQSSPRSESSSLGGEDELDSDSAVSSGRSSPPHESRDMSLRRTLSSDSSSSCTLSGSSSERRVLKAQSVEATNRKNVLASARSSSGRGGVTGSPLIQRRFSDDETEEATRLAPLPRQAEPEPPLGNSGNSKPSVVVHTLIQSTGEVERAATLGQQPFKVAYVDEICELELVPEAPVDTPPPTPVTPPPPEVPVIVAPSPPIPSVREARNPPAVAPRNSPSQRSMLPQPLRVTEMRAKSSPTLPVSPPPAPPTSPPAAVKEETCVITTRTVQLSAAPSATPRLSTSAKDVTDAPARTPAARERSWQRETKITSITSSHSSRHEQVQTFRDIADRWHSMADTPPPAPVQVSAAPAQSIPRAAPAKPGRRSASVNDIRRAFEKNPTSAPNATPSAIPISHTRVSSLDSSASGRSCGEDILLTTNSAGAMPLSSANSFEQLGSISSLASSTSFISQQELQELLDEAAAEEGAPSGEFLVVVLHRDSATSSVGITLAGGADYESRDITVHKVLTGSPAERDGRVQKGDRILSINGRSMKGLTHREALQILKAPRPEVVLVVSHCRGDTSSCSEDSSSMSAASTPRPSLSSASPAALPLEEISTTPVASTTGTPILVSLCKDGAGLGFSLEGGKDSPLGDRPLTIKKVFTGGAAEKSGQLHAGNQLLAVNGTDVSSMSRIEAWGLMKRLPPGPVTLLIRS